ncbi:regulator of nonsense transcripts 3B-like [Schistocerca gregaria]|uniref:regulator of nonsense transcripts 3B-like n=1 Tax=Schistocerca gregaria TaxID=7010 RepID=UPI00211F1CCD|nr:regulator of nonsense transcripts 3B-like [Schistocerca gregaria]
MSKNEPGTELVVRHLPTDLTEASFRERISDFSGAIDNLIYFSGKKHAGVYIHSRAYINFKSVEELFSFAQNFDQYAFTNSATGKSFPCGIEFAPYQHVRSRQHLVEWLSSNSHTNNQQETLKTGADPLHNTLDRDLDYLLFLEQLNSSSLPNPEEQKIEEDNSKLTPLVEEMKQLAITKAKSLQVKNNDLEKHQKTSSSSPSRSHQPSFPQRKRNKKKEVSRKSPSETGPKDVNTSTAKQKVQKKGKENKSRKSAAKRTNAVTDKKANSKSKERKTKEKVLRPKKQPESKI